MKIEKQERIEDHSEDQNRSGYRKTSPFAVHFSEILKRHKKIINLKSKKKKFYSKKKFNHYYCPKIFKILYSYVHLMPLWSSVLLEICNSYYKLTLEGLTNNPCENWFDQIKESMRNFIPLMPSDYASYIFNSIESYVEEFRDVRTTALKKYKDFNRDSTEK